MPRAALTGTSPRWDDLYGSACSQAGYFSSEQAEQAGYSPQLLVYYLHQGRVQRAGRGLWRLVHFPSSEHEDLVPVWLWSERRGVFGHETALLLHGLSDVLPDQVHLTLPLSWSRRRLKVPPRIVLSWADLTPAETTWAGPVPVTTPHRTLRDCLDAHVPPDLIRQAIEQGVGRGMLRSEEGRQLLDDLARKREL